MDTLREELLKKNEQEKALLYERLDLLQQKQASQISQTSNMSVTDSDGYNVMQRVGMDISNRVVVGEDEKRLSYQKDDEGFINTSVPIAEIDCENEWNSVQLGASYTDTFINIHSGDDIAKGLPEHSLYRYVVRINYRIQGNFCFRPCKRIFVVLFCSAA